MRNLIVLFFAFTANISFAQTGEEVVMTDHIKKEEPVLVSAEPKTIKARSLLAVKSDILTGFANGNAKQLSKYFPANLDITISGKSNLYSKSQAEQVLNTFFTQNKVSGFSIVHEGQSNGTKYFIGSYSSGSKKFRVTINVKSSGTSDQITSISIEN